MRIDNDLIAYKSISSYKDWKDVVHLGVELLVKKQKATKKLAEQIIESTRKYGVYYIIAPNLALLHAAPSSESKEAAVSLMVLEESIEFGFKDKKSAKIIFTLSSPDGDSHMEIIKSLMLFLQKDNVINELYKCKTKDQIKILLKKVKGGN